MAFPQRSSRRSTHSTTGAPRPITVKMILSSECVGDGVFFYREPSAPDSSSGQEVISVTLTGRIVSSTAANTTEGRTTGSSTSRMSYRTLMFTDGSGIIPIKQWLSSNTAAPPFPLEDGHLTGGELVFVVGTVRLGEDRQPFVASTIIRPLLHSTELLYHQLDVIDTFERIKSLQMAKAAPHSATGSGAVHARGGVGPALVPNIAGYSHPHAQQQPQRPTGPSGGSRFGAAHQPYPQEQHRSTATHTNTYIAQTNTRTAHAMEKIAATVLEIVRQASFPQGAAHTGITRHQLFQEVRNRTGVADHVIEAAILSQQEDATLVTDNEGRFSIGEY